MQENEDFSAIVRADLRNRFDEQDNKLRPTMLSDFLGQESVKKNLSTFIEAAKLREEPLDHLLLIGPPGLGKTTLAQITAHELGVDFKVTSAPALDALIAAAHPAHPPPTTTTFAIHIPPILFKIT